MRTLQLSIITVIASLIFSFTSHAKNTLIKELLPTYVSIQEALAADDLLQAQQKALELDKQITETKSNEFKDLSVNLNSLNKAKSLADARKSFKKLSAPFVKGIETNKDTEFDVVYCPMAGAKWVQKKGEILNPYFGKEMLHCGEKSS